MKSKNTKKLVSAIVQGLVSGGAGYAVALVGDKLARMAFKYNVFDPAIQDYAKIGGRLVAAGGLGYMAGKGKAKKMPISLPTAMIGAAIATGAQVLDLPQLAGIKAQINNALGGDRVFEIPVNSYQDAMAVARAMKGNVAFAGDSIAFAGKSPIQYGLGSDQISNYGL